MKTSVVKQDINFLDKPLWFQTMDTSENKIWRDVDGYIYRAGYKVPDKVDALFLMYLLLRSQQQGYVENIVVSRYEVIRNCNLTVNDAYYARLEDSLRRWTNVSVEFHGTFYDGIAYKTIAFGIIDAYRIREEDKRLEIRFSPEWLLTIEKSAFFKYINFDFYKALKRPVSRRLFEILCKSFYDRSVWEIDAVKLGQKLTLSTRKVTIDGIEKEVLYPSTVLIAIKPAVNEINKNALNPDLLKEAKLSPQEAFTVTYTVRNGSGGNKVLHFNKIPVSKHRPSIGAGPVESADKQAQVIDPPMQELFDLMKHSTQHLKNTVSSYCCEKGPEYVRWNILYANGNATKNYAAYLKQALEKDWAAQLREEHEAEKSKLKAQQALDSKIRIKLEEARQAEYIILPTGVRYKIQMVSPSNAVFVEKDGHMCGVVIPEQLVLCQFE